MLKTVYLTVLMIMLCGLGCSEDDSGVDYRLTETYQVTDKIRYRVEGGGNIDFTIQAESSHYRIEVTQYDFGPVDQTFTLSEAELDIDDSLLLSSLMQGTINLGGTILTPQGPTGSWTYIYIQRDGAWLRVASGVVIDGLGSIYHLVRNRFPGG